MAASQEQPDRDLLISRVVDGTARDADWTALDALASGDQGVWRELAMAQRQQVCLMRAVDESIAVASQVDLPDEAPALHFPSRQQTWWIGRWAGWVAAAVLGVAWVSSGHLNTNQPPIVKSNEAGVGSGVVDAGSRLVKNAADALSAYFDKGAEEKRVLGEMPTKLLLRTNPAASGKGYEVYFVRQIVERVEVPDLRMLSTDEFGNVRPAEVDIRPASADSM